MSKHTPGPWKLDVAYDTVLGKRGKHDWWQDIAEMVCYGNTDETDANAFLIRAAPELLAECEYWLHDGRFLTANCDEYNAAVDRLIAVIAKAKGEA